MYFSTVNKEDILLLQWIDLANWSPSNKQRTKFILLQSNAN